jgi:hypothetical protein
MQNARGPRETRAAFRFYEAIETGVKPRSIHEPLYYLLSKVTPGLQIYRNFDVILVLNRH